MRAPDPFKRAQDRANAAVLRHLANAEATWQGGEPFGILFDSQEGDPMLGGSPLTMVRNEVSLLVTMCQGIDEGASGLLIAGISYVVASAVVPDSSGWATFSVVAEPA